MTQSKFIQMSIETHQNYLTMQLSPEALANIRLKVAGLEIRLAEQLIVEAATDYQEPKFEMPAWGTYGT